MQGVSGSNPLSSIFRDDDDWWNSVTPVASSDPIQTVAALFDQWASSDRASNMADGHAHLMQALLADICPGSPSESLLDLGCGTGKFLALAKGCGVDHRAGIDVSPQMIATSKTSDPTADIRIGQFEALPWPNQHFNQVTTIEALYYCPKPELALKEVKRVLQPSGRFDMIIDYYIESEGTASWAEGLGFEISRLAIAEWISLIESVGLKHCQTRQILDPDASKKVDCWQPSVWHPTRPSYENYLENGALWITAMRSH